MPSPSSFFTSPDLFPSPLGKNAPTTSGWRSEWRGRLSERCRGYAYHVRAIVLSCLPPLHQFLLPLPAFRIPPLPTMPLFPSPPARTLPRRRHGDPSGGDDGLSGVTDKERARTLLGGFVLFTSFSHRLGFNCSRAFVLPSLSQPLRSGWRRGSRYSSPSCCWSKMFCEAFAMSCTQNAAQ
eukprot:805935-Rhodomonas_salina.3